MSIIQPRLKWHHWQETICWRDTDWILSVRRYNILSFFVFPQHLLEFWQDDKGIPIFLPFWEFVLMYKDKTYISGLNSMFIIPFWRLWNLLVVQYRVMRVDLYIKFTLRQMCRPNVILNVLMVGRERAEYAQWISILCYIGSQNLPDHL